MVYAKAKPRKMHYLRARAPCTVQTLESSCVGNSRDIDTFTDSSAATGSTAAASQAHRRAWRSSMTTADSAPVASTSGRSDNTQVRCMLCSVCLRHHCSESYL